MAVGGHWAFYLPASLAVAVAVVTLVYYAKVQRAVLGGEPSEATARAREAPFAMCLASVFLAVLCLASALVVLPAVRQRLVDPAVAVLKAAVPLPPASDAEPSTVALDAAGRVP